MKARGSVEQPSKKELFILRFIIIAGIVSMGVLLYCLFNPSYIGNVPLYWLLMCAIVFSCLKILHEWYHYFYITIPPVPANDARPTADIFTTFCAGEPYEMIIETLTAIQAITYPHTAYLCDEANDPYLKDICGQLGVIHVTRNNRLNAKAGNINNALQYATGELCVILDPDHVPTPDFLDTVVPYFDSPEIGFVQIVQAYGNIGESIIAKGAAQQTFQFYGPMMMTMNKYGTVQAIGANCTFRRAALNSIGGHAPGLAEDMHTAMQLHAKGWKSVYVPAIRSLGLVPSTLSAYYQQQLKWSRGTFELLVTAYPALFRQFTWRQKLHYGTLPFHYFSGVIYFINFLVPILSLVLGVIPFRFDLLSFTLIGLPFISSIVLVRHFMQRWVMDEDESGFHVVGGLLLIGTWWIFILGLVYTVIRKKVPYIPTPKDNKENNSWPLLIPNLVILLASVTAIIYGLWLDWNPFTLVMAGIAGINCLIMLFNIIAGSLKRREYATAPYTTADRLHHQVGNLKIRLWKFRHAIYGVVRKTALLIALVIYATTAWLLYEDARPPVSSASQATPPISFFYTGIFSPSGTSGLTSLQQVNSYTKSTGSKFNIISCYIPWGDAPGSLLPDSLIQGIYSTGAVPMITWEPWAALFATAKQDPQLRREQKVMKHISDGYFDAYLEKFAQQVRSLERPVYIRFGHEPDNPAYPWSATGLNTPAEYVEAWQYIHDYFNRKGARNVIWVWNPWKAEAAESYFPGKEYTDWLGVTILNYSYMNPDKKWYSFHQLYSPFHHNPVFNTGLPVMIAEMGSLATGGNQQKWFQDAFRDITIHFKEIKATVLFNSSFDKNITGPAALDWKLQNPAATLAQLDSLQESPGVSSRSLPLLLTTGETIKHNQPPPTDTLRGVIYSKGIPWFRNQHTVTHKEALIDIQAMKQAGINTIRRYGPGVYDHNILAAARQLNMQVQYSFWMPAYISGEKWKQQAADFSATVLATIKKRKDNNNITGWHLGNNSWAALPLQYSKRALLYEEEVYLTWLKALVQDIRRIDPARRITIDLPLDQHTAVTLEVFSRAIPEVAAWGLAASADTTSVTLPETAIPYFLSGIDPEPYLLLKNKVPVFINTWQDLQTRELVTFNGLLDQRGYYKPAYFQLARYWNKPMEHAPLPPVKILRPAKIVVPGTSLSYHALIYEDQWRLAVAGEKDLHFTWYLYKTDREGNAIYMERLGDGTEMTLTVPDDPGIFRLYLEARKGKEVITAQCGLN